MEFSSVDSNATPLVRARINEAKASCQIFGKCALFTLTVAPKSMEDLPSKLNSIILHEVEKQGLSSAVIIDAHNSIDGPLDAEKAIDSIKRAALKALEMALLQQTFSYFEVGAAKIIPEEYTVALTGSPNDERELVIKNFLDAGTGEGQTSFYAATEADGLDKLLQKSNFYLFLCNPKPKVKVPDLPNVYKLHSKSDINNLHIALVKANRTVEQSSTKRICINVVSDVLVAYGVKTTRKWIAEITTDLISKGFTILAVINPLVHTPEELNTLLELFDGEINLTQTEDPLACKRSIRVKKLRNQDFIKNPVCLTKQKK